MIPQFNIMFVLLGECLLCGSTTTSKRQHWCDPTGFIIFFSILTAINQSIHTSTLISLCITDKENHPYWMSRTRAADYISRFISDDTLRTKADPIDPRKNIIGLNDNSVMRYKEIMKKHRNNLETMFDDDKIDEKEVNSNKDKIKTLSKNLEKLVQKTSIIIENRL